MNPRTSKGIRADVMLTVVFISLKLLLHIETLPWWFVLSPLWAPTTIALVGIAIWEITD